MWIQHLLGDFKIVVPLTITIFEDNQSCIQYATNPFGRTRMKHIPLRYFFLREKIGRNEVKLIHVKSAENVADVFTNNLPKSTLQGQVEMLNLSAPPNPGF